MMRRTGLALVSAMLLAGLGCASHGPKLDVTEAKIAAPPEKVRQAVMEVLTNSGYEDIVWTSNTTLETGYREEFESVWLGLYRCCWGVVKSRAKATVTPVNDQTTQLRLEVLGEGKRILYDKWAPVQPQAPESADNQLRLIKNKLKIVTHPYTTQSFFKMQ